MSPLRTLRPGPAWLAAVAFVLAMNVARGHAQTAPAEEAGSGPSDVSGVLVPESGEGQPSPARALLVVPRLAVATVAMPLRAGMGFYERHHISERAIDIFFDDTRTFGVYPGISFESGTSIGFGVRVVHRNLFGTGVRFKGAADGGGEHQRRLDASVGSAALFGAPVWLHLRGGWQHQARAPFYGIGDRREPFPTGDTSPARHFQQTVKRTQLSLDTNPAGPLFGKVEATFVSRRFSPNPDTLESDEGAAMALETLPGWRGTDVFYAEVQVGLDTVEVASPYLPASSPSRGTRLLLFGGPAFGVDGDLTRYLRYGFEARRYFDLHAGDRVLMLRGYAEGVTAGSVPFTDLPRLGGPQQLRGFTRDRFRDRLAVLGTAEYRYPIWQELGAFLFVDAGRVLSGADQLDRLARAPERLRVGGGGGLEKHGGNRFRMRGQIAGSADGLFFELSFQPAYRVTSPSYRI
jgi:hypothetical protein